MLNLQQLQEIAQLIDSMSLSLGKINKAYANNNAENFSMLKAEILKAQSKISFLAKGGD